jgi:type III secretory pathway lipoprotein EscJ
MSDLGLGAEDVARIDPLLVTYNAAGQVEGVKYDRIGVVLLNAVTEQQAHIEAQQKQINEQKALIENLRLLVCQRNARVEVCKNK